MQRSGPFVDTGGIAEAFRPGEAVERRAKGRGAIERGIVIQRGRDWSVVADLGKDTDGKPTVKDGPRAPMTRALTSGSEPKASMI